MVPLPPRPVAIPDHLASIPQPPTTLWATGTLPTTPGVAIVGTRRCTSYGRRVARSLGAAVGAAGWVTVSGLARGVDAEAHRGMLTAGGTGIAVLGSGADVIYPADHRALAAELVAGGGVVVSEYPPGTPPAPFRFPARNRIIAGLAAVVVVVEAAVTGGALITARLALEQGREVFAVPGDVDRETSMGCNLLIRDGALPVLGPGDLIESLGLILGPPPNPTLPDGMEPPRVWEGEDPGRVGQMLADLARSEIDAALAGKPSPRDKPS
jgi:DNA processing protein